MGTNSDKGLRTVPTVRDLSTGKQIFETEECTLNDKDSFHNTDLSIQNGESL